MTRAWTIAVWSTCSALTLRADENIKKSQVKDKTEDDFDEPQVNLEQPQKIKLGEKTMRTPLDQMMAAKRELLEDYYEEWVTKSEKNGGGSIRIFLDDSSQYDKIFENMKNRSVKDVLPAEPLQEDGLTVFFPKECKTVGDFIDHMKMKWSDLVKSNVSTIAVGGHFKLIFEESNSEPDEVPKEKALELVAMEALQRHLYLSPAALVSEPIAPAIQDRIVAAKQKSVGSKVKSVVSKVYRWFK